MKISTDHHDLLLPQHPFPAGQLSDMEAVGITGFKEVRVTVSAPLSPAFGHVLQGALAGLLEGYKVYLVYVENFPQPPSRMRSVKKMFHGRRDKIGRTNLIEDEVEMGDNQSALVGMVRLDKHNLAYCIDSLDSSFAFGWMVRKGERSFPSGRQAFLHGLPAKRLEGIRSLKVNVLKVLSHLPSGHRMLFTLHAAADGREVLSFFLRQGSALPDAVAAAVRLETGVMGN